MPFQTQVNFQQGYAVQGDFATTNPLVSYAANESGFISGAQGILIGTFVWQEPNGVIVNNFGTGKPIGFVARENQAVISQFLEEGTLKIPAGRNITVFRQGDFFAKNVFNASITGQKIFANLTDGSIASFDSGTIASGYVETDFSVYLNADINELTIISCAFNSITYVPPDAGDFIITSNGDFIVTSNGDFIIAS